MTSAKEVGLTVQGYSGEEALVLCPWHNDRKASAWYSEKKELFYCSVCGFGKNLVQLAEKLGTDLSELEFNRNLSDIQDYDLFNDTLQFELGRPAYHKYFQERGVGEETIELYGVQWVDDRGGAAVFPMYNLEHLAQGVAYRYLRPEVWFTRYRVKGELTSVWPLSVLVKNGVTRVIVTEGPFSALKLHHVASKLMLKTNNLAIVSLMGAKANQKILDTLRPFKTTYLYDNDRAGWNACRKMRRLSPTADAHVIEVSPDDMNMKQIQRLLERLEGSGENKH